MVTMGLSRTLPEINDNCGRKTQIFLPHVGYITPQLKVLLLTNKINVNKKLSYR